ncbi:CaiB/BaiF CoA transferase family protein [Micromonospora sp. NBC_01412]|uniref:CaiB/BaiF CoA transferase family protein n=1 Tax=Micromonospora sp. NBC_01412 TaxID=2903590 RepID=UPI0032511F96
MTGPHASPPGCPLEGLVVADFSRVLAGPLATMTLADLGAQVIKIERPGTGDDTRTWGPPYSRRSTTYYESLNRGKRSIALDLGDPVDRETAFEIAVRADIVVENFKPGTMDRLGLGYGAVSARNPGTVYCSITGFGSGAGRDLLGYDFVVQAVGGLMSITGHPDGDPVKVGVAVVDVLTGKDAVAGILAAIIARQRTGLGDHIEVTLLTSLLGSLINQGQASLETGTAGRPMGNRHPSVVPYETLRCRDGLIAVACGNDGQFARLVTVLGDAGLAGRPEFRTNADRVAHRDDLVPELERLLCAADGDTWVDRLRAALVPVGKVNDIPQAIAFAEELGLSPTVEVGVGWTRQLRHPVSWSRYRTAAPTPPPDNGADTDEVLAWLSATDPRPSPTSVRE